MPAEQTPLYLKDYQPRPKLVTPATAVPRPRFPAIDAHNHLDVEFGGNWVARPVEELIDVLDRSGIRRLVDLDGGWGEDVLDRHLAYCKEPYPDRFVVFGGVDWTRWAEEGNRFGEESARRLVAQVRRGAEGLKIWKPLGIHIRDDRGERVPVDDPRLDPIWAQAAALNIPIIIHTADPVAFFDPLDEHNELYDCLHARPDWHFYGPGMPSFQQLMDELESLVARHPETTFIGAHVGCYSENLQWVGRMLDAYPNFFVDIAARINELGRKPYSARDFIIRYQDRVLFGTDAAPNPASYAVYYRFLESRDEYFPYGPGEAAFLGRWRIYGLYLPEDVLEKVYFRNAERLTTNRVEAGNA